MSSVWGLSGKNLSLPETFAAGGTSPRWGHHLSDQACWRAGDSRVVYPPPSHRNSRRVEQTLLSVYGARYDRLDQITDPVLTLVSPQYQALCNKRSPFSNPNRCHAMSMSLVTAEVLPTSVSTAHIRASLDTSRKAQTWSVRSEGKLEGMSRGANRGRVSSKCHGWRRH